MGNLFILYSALTVFGIGVTLIDFLGILDHAGGHDAGHDGHAGDYADTGGHESAGGADGNHGAGHTDGGGDHGPGGHNDSRGDNAEHDHGSYLSPGDAGVRAVTAVMGLLRTVVYFSLGFGPTGLFAWFTGLSRT
ncbi:MAG: hypothetical protein LBK77_05240, partial [Spirochaetaceae bacterium]|nr:hypothetical protein [Spirochaetaceae bacterium]